jgi:hypothetical protein
MYGADNWLLMLGMEKRSFRNRPLSHKVIIKKA